MDGIEELKGVVVLAATNRLDLVDPALLRKGRFDLLLELPEPDEASRLKIFNIHTKGKPLDEDVNLEELARHTQNKVGSDIEFICRKASMLAIKEYISQSKGDRTRGAELKISMKHFEEALKLAGNRPSVMEL
jgi:transitional endoplasmic reticulum ATPase